MKKIYDHIRGNFLGTVTLVFALLFLFLGLPAQIFKIWTRGSAEDISLAAFLLLGIQSLFWALYGRQKKDWVIIIPNTFAVLFAAAIVAEYFLFG